MQKEIKSKSEVSEQDSLSTFQMKPIGYISSVFRFKNGTPRQSNICSSATGKLTLSKSVFNNPDHALEGLDQFSHVWVIFVFHQNNNSYTKAKVRPPRLNGKRVGLYSTRCPYRPNPIGLTLAKLDRILGSTIYLSGLDILDGTPVLDIKPYISLYDQPTQDVGDTACMKDVIQTVKSEQLDVQLSQEYSHHIDSNAEEISDDNITTDEDLLTHVSTTPVLTNFLNSKHEVGNVLVKSSDQSAKLRQNIPAQSRSLSNQCEPASNEDDGQNCLSNPSAVFRTVANTSEFASWIEATPVHPLTVRFTTLAESQLGKFSQDASESEFRLNLLESSDQAKCAITEILCADARSTYRRTRCQDRLHYFTCDVMHVTCWYDVDIVEVVRIQPISQSGLSLNMS